MVHRSGTCLRVLEVTLMDLLLKLRRLVKTPRFSSSTNKLPYLLLLQINLAFRQAAVRGAIVRTGDGASFRNMFTSTGGDADGSNIKASPIGEDTPFLVQYKQATVFAPSSNKEPRPTVVTKNGERLLQLKVAPEDNAFRMCLFEERVPAGDGTPIHVHLMEDEFFTFVEGTFKVVAGKNVLDVQARETVFVPRGTPHARCNVGNTPGKLYFGFTPSHKGHKLIQDFSEPGFYETTSKETMEEYYDIENLTTYFMTPDAEELRTGWQGPATN